MGKPFKLAVKAIIEDSQGRCLLIRRSPQNRRYTGQWEWPGGKVDPGEDFADATCRETLEETGLEVELTGLAGSSQFEMEAIYVVVLFMEARIKGGTLKLSEEHDELAWVAWSELPAWNLTDNMRSFALEYLQRKVKG